MQESNYEDAEKDFPLPQIKGHIWKQYGNKLDCDSCPVSHSIILPVGMYLSGYKDGTPIISPIATRLAVPPPQGASESTKS
jgi:hypothetical protein